MIYVGGCDPAQAENKHDQTEQTIGRHLDAVVAVIHARQQILSKGHSSGAERARVAAHAGEAPSLCFVSAAPPLCLSRLTRALIGALRIGKITDGEREQGWEAPLSAAQPSSAASPRRTSTLCVVKIIEARSEDVN